LIGVVANKVVDVLFCIIEDYGWVCKTMVGMLTPAILHAKLAGYRLMAIIVACPAWKYPSGGAFICLKME
jgi:hypothetical protein